MNHTGGDKPFTPKPRPEDEELSSDEELDDWLKTEIDLHNKGKQIEASSNKTNEVHEMSFVEEDDIQNEENDISVALPCQLPPKELNPGSFTLPYTIDSLNLYSIADLGARVNIMPRLIFEHLNLVNRKKTDMLVEMADMTRRAPLGIVENVLGLEVEHKEVKNFKKITSRWHVCKPVRVFYDNKCGKDYGMWPTCNPDLSFCSGYDAIYGKNKNGMLEQWIRYGNKSIGDTTRKRRYYEWVAQNIKFNDNGIPQEGTIYDNHYSFDVEIDYGKTRDDPYSRRFDEYKEKGYALDDIWEICEDFYGGTVYLWLDEGFKEEERGESGTEKTDYEQPFVDIETFESKGIPSRKEGVLSV
ncbi:hypothetical protein Tco_0877772 [Tanacetum coccineum]|uniref:Uncharacterized protein n=1 Tax=Tanacetum coccineum TaxID=301880 RepID=A0ABQ5BYS0_9ASTR